MQTSYSHKKDHNDLDPHVIVIGDTEVFGTESSGSNGRKGVIHGIEPIHTGNSQQNGLCKGQSHINHQQNMQDLLCFVSVVLFSHGGELHAGEFHTILCAGSRQNHQGEHHNPDTTQPMGSRTPKHHSIRQRLYIVQNSGTGSGISRNAFEPGIDQIELAPPENVGQHTGHTSYDP